jgi:AcrR family transcriptional regulator
MADSTKDTILDAAEQLFATKGFAATSLRAIIKAAGVNTAAIHYHFGSRAGLVAAVLARRAEPVNAERLRRLTALEARHGDGAVPVEDVVDAFVRPVLEHLDPEPAASLLPRLLGRVIIDADADLHESVRHTFGATASRFLGALSRSLPHLDEEELFWRMHFVIGAMAFGVVMPCAFRAGDDVLFRRGDPEETARRLVRFAAAGLRAGAPLAAGRKPS